MSKELHWLFVVGLTAIVGVFFMVGYSMGISFDGVTGNYIAGQQYGDYKQVGQSVSDGDAYRFGVVVNKPKGVVNPRERENPRLRYAEGDDIPEVIALTQLQAHYSVLCEEGNELGCGMIKPATELAKMNVKTKFDFTDWKVKNGHLDTMSVVETYEQLGRLAGRIN
jgi:hypothetical protein